MNRRESWPSQWRRLVWIWVALLGLMLLSLFVAYLPIAPGWKAAAGLLIAGIKATLVVLIYMQLGRHHTLARMAVALALWTLLVMGGLSAVDYLTRRLEPAEVQQPLTLPALISYPAARSR